MPESESEPTVEPRRLNPARANAVSEDESVEQARVVRPYALTGGRTRTHRAHLPLEALVRGVSGTSERAGNSERRRILELVGERILSIAELSAYISLPLGVVRVLVGDLADEGLVVVHSGRAGTAAPATNLKVLEGVLHGISTL